MRIWYGTVQTQIRNVWVLDHGRRRAGDGTGQLINEVVGPKTPKFKIAGMNTMLEHNLPLPPGKRKYWAKRMGREQGKKEENVKENEWKSEDKKKMKSKRVKLS